VLGQRADVFRRWPEGRLAKPPRWLRPTVLETINVLHIFALVGQFVRSDDGQDLMEYGLLVALIAIVALAAVGTVGSTINTVFWQMIAQNV
jgi:Flp pilus assembly pilin Flp